MNDSTIQKKKKGAFKAFGSKISKIGNKIASNVPLKKGNKANGLAANMLTDE